MVSVTPVAVLVLVPGASDKLLTLVVAFIVGYLGRPAGMITADVETGTTLLFQLAGFSHMILTLPVQL